MSTTPQDRRKRTDAPPGDATPDDAEAPDADETTAAPPGDECEGQPVNTTDDLRTRKIFELRNKIASGDYEIDAETIAKRIVDDI
jgi:anti-sigma28 factor (negative regulator of flagellin synthesis)